MKIETLEFYLNKIHTDDCNNLMLKLPENSIDLVVTSPPYDKMREYSSEKEFNFRKVLINIKRILKDGGVCVWVVGDQTTKGSETGTSFKQALFAMEIGLLLHDTMIYQKSNCSYPSQHRYYQIFEYMFIFSKGKPKSFNPIKDRRNIYAGQLPHGKSRQKNGWQPNRGKAPSKEFGVRYNIWRYVTGGGNVTKDKYAYDHPAIFPEKLAIDHVKSWSNKGDIVLDPMCGSGTVCKAAKTEGRNFIGVEIDKDYSSIAKRRVSQLGC